MTGDYGFLSKSAIMAPTVSPSQYGEVARIANDMQSVVSDSHRSDNPLGTTVDLLHEMNNNNVSIRTEYGTRIFAVVNMLGELAEKYNEEDAAREKLDEIKSLLEA